MPVFLGYDQTERMIAALLDRAAAWQPDAVVGIARGGLVPATMAAGLLASPLAMIGFERATGVDAVDRRAASAGRILLVDDGCTTGRTMRAVRAALLREGRDCLTLAVVHDPEVTATCPTCRIRCARCGASRGSAARPRQRAVRCVPRAPDRTGRPSCRSTAWISMACSCPTCRTRCTRPTSPTRCAQRHGTGAVRHPALLLARARGGDHRAAGDRTASGPRHGWPARVMARCRWNAARQHAAHTPSDRALQGRDGDALGLHAFRRKRCRADIADRGTCAASGGKLVVGDGGARLADRRRGPARIKSCRTRA